MEIFNFCNLEMPIGQDLTWTAEAITRQAKIRAAFSCRHSKTETPQDGNRGAEEERCEP